MLMVAQRPLENPLCILHSNLMKRECIARNPPIVTGIQRYTPETNGAFATVHSVTLIRRFHSKWMNQNRK